MLNSPDSDLPLIVILGPTASGKSGYAVQLARLIDGEIICADSRTIYRGMDIGTAKPTVSERGGVPHWGLDLVEPSERFTVYDFQKYVNGKIQEIRQRGHVPLLVGGSAMWIDSVLYDFQLGGEVNSELRDKLNKLSLIELKNYAIARGVELPIDSDNKRRLIRAIELGGVNKKCSQLRPHTIVIGILAERSELRRRSLTRSRQMIAGGLISEVTELAKKYGDVEPLKRNAYGAVKQLMSTGQPIDEVELVDKLVTADMHLVKKQQTWWRNRPVSQDIMWCTLPELTEQLGQWSNAAGVDIVDALRAEYNNFKSIKNRD